MSLILQALKKAEAERSVGRVPTLDQVTAADPPSSAAPRRAAWVAAAVGLGVVGIGAAAWFWTTTGRVAPPAVAPAAMREAALPAPVAALPAASPPVAESAPAPRAGTAVAPAASVVTSLSAMPPSAASAATALPPPRPASAPARPASAAEAPLPALHDLPVAVRQALPPLPLGGSIWSPNPAERMLILGGEVRREGDAITPELVLVSIGPRSAVLRWREQSFRLPY